MKINDKLNTHMNAADVLIVVSQQLDEVIKLLKKKKRKRKPMERGK